MKCFTTGVGAVCLILAGRTTGERGGPQFKDSVGQQDK